MTTQDELTMLETAYAAFTNGGMAQSYTVGGSGVTRTITRADVGWLTKRIDLLRRQLARESPTGEAAVVQFVEPE